MKRPLFAPVGAIFIAAVTPYQQWKMMGATIAQSDAHRLALILAIFTVLLLIVFRFLTRDWQKAGFLTSAVVMLFAQRYIGLAIPLMFYAVFMVSLLIDRAGVYRTMALFTNILAIGVIASHASVFARLLQPDQIITAQPMTSEPIVLRISPTIIHIVLDGYGSSEQLARDYNHDNSNFRDTLTTRGFQVFDDVRTPFNQTLFVMASIFSGNYISTPSEMGAVNEYRQNLGFTISQSPVRHVLEAAEYSISYTPSGYDYVNLQGGEALGFNVFDLTLLEASMLPAASRRMSQIRNRLLRDALGPDNYQSLTLPTFLYQHILAPHPPFSIGADGNFRETPMDTLSDGSHAIMDSPDLRAEYIRGYSEKAEFVELALLAQITAMPDSEPLVVIIHGDHGPGAYFDQEKIENTCTGERMKTFFAVYSNIPEVRYAFSNANQEPFNLVNIYRVLFAALSESPIEQLPSRSQFLRWSRPDVAQYVTDSQLMDACQVPSP